MSPRGLIEFAIVREAPGTSIGVNVAGWRASVAACAARESAKQPSANRIVPNVMLNFFISILLIVLAFFEFSPCRLRPRTRVATASKRKSFPAVRWCTARNWARCYAQSFESTADYADVTDERCRGSRVGCLC